MHLDYKWSLFRSVRHAWRERKPREKNGHAKSWRRGARERRDYCLSQRVWPFMAEWFFGVGFLILTSSYYRLLSITLGDLNKIALLYSSSSQAKHMPWEVYLRSVFIQRNCQRSFKKKMANEASCNDFHCACRCKSTSYCKNFKCRVSTGNLHYVFDMGDPAVKCLPISAESFRWMSSFKWKSSSIFQMDGRKAKLGEFTFADLDNAVEWQNH